MRELGERNIRKASAFSTTIEILAYSRGIQWYISFMGADGNGDGVVDVADLTPIAARYGERDNHIADYNYDGIVDVRDITRIAQNYGVNCGGFTVQYSSTGPDSGYSLGAQLEYGEYTIKVWNNRLYRVACYPWTQPRLWAKLQVLDKDGGVIGEAVREIPVGGDWPLILKMDTPIKLSESAITWDTDGMFADGNQDGVTDWFDLGFLNEYYGIDSSESSYSPVFDYNHDGQISTGDTAAVAMSYQCGVGEFTVELSTTAASVGFSAIGSVGYFDSTGFTADGFRYYEYTISSPPVSGLYWVRIVPYGKNGTPSVPSDAVEFSGS